MTTIKNTENCGKVLLVNPDWVSHRRVVQPLFKRAWQPLCLANSASLLEDAGFFVKIVDNNIEKLPLTSIGKIAEKFDKVFLTTAPYDRWQCPPVDITHFFETTRYIPQEKLYIMGPHVTQRPDGLLRKTGARAAVIGEPEKTVLELALNDNGKDVPENIKGVAYFKDNLFCMSPPQHYLEMDEFPLPSFHLLPMKSYSYELMGGDFTIMETSRGCPFKCCFCYKGMFNGGFRQKDPIRFAGEVIRVKERFGISNIYFMDLEFGLNREFLISFCTELIRCKANINWCCQTRVTDVDREAIRLMKESGCSLIHFGVESGSERILNRTGKKITTDQCKRAVALARDFNIRTALFFSFGFSGETKSDMEKTIEFAVKLNPTYASFNMLIPYPGTGLAKEAGISEKSGNGETYPHYNLAHHDFMMLKKIVRKAYLRFYLRPLYLINLLKKRYKRGGLELFFQRLKQ